MGMARAQAAAGRTSLMTNNKLKVLSVFGTRPEAIKMAPLILEMKKRPQIESYCLITAQHREMLDSVLTVFGIVPDYDLNIMQENQSLYSITSKTLLGMEKVLADLKPDIVLVHGDTSTTFAGALSSFYQKIRVGHVEAGLRTFDRYSPYPEEINRTLVSDIAELHFAPTALNRDNLVREGVKGEIFVTGNTVIDSLKVTVRSDYRFSQKALRDLDFGFKRVIVLTAHRRENYGEGLENIMLAAKDIAEKYEDVLIIYPVHRSPIVTKTAKDILKGVKRVHLIDPISAEEMHNLMARCYMVLTDSGGIQEEAPSLGKPVLVLRRETERPEAVAAGTVRIAGVKREEIFKQAAILLDDESEYASMAHAVNPYGDGFACLRIADAILWSFGLIAQRPIDFA